MMVDLLLVALAASCLRDYWFHGSIFAELRDRVQSWALFEEDYQAAGYVGKFCDFLSRLLACSLCFTFHAGIFAGSFHVLSQVTGQPLWMLPVHVLAGIYLSLLFETQFGR
jgi:hypothetical protein